MYKFKPSPLVEKLYEEINKSVKSSEIEPYIIDGIISGLLLEYMETTSENQEFKGFGSLNADDFNKLVDLIDEENAPFEEIKPLEEELGDIDSFEDED